MPPQPDLTPAAAGPGRRMRDLRPADRRRATGGPAADTRRSRGPTDGVGAAGLVAAGRRRVASPGRDAG